MNHCTSSGDLSKKQNYGGDLDFLESVRKLGLSDETIEKLNLGMVTTSDGKKLLAIPVFYNGVVMDVRRYNLLKHSNIPKMIGNKDTEIGFVFPHDLWKKRYEENISPRR